jgi:DNA-binding CsgD family transcriptional regulator
MVCHAERVESADPPIVDLEEWLDDVRRTFERPSVSRAPLLALDARTGDVLGVTPSACDLLGFRPERVDELVEAGVVARPDLALLAARVRATLGVPPMREAAESWSTTVRIHRSGRPSQVIGLHVAHHRRPQLGAEVLWTTLLPDPTEAQPPPAAPDPAGPVRWVSVLDREARVVAVGPEARALWPDLDAVLGMVATAMVHPEDIEAVLPSANAVFNGRRDRASYTVRIAAADGSWVPVENHLQRVLGTSAHLVVLDNVVVEASRRPIPDGRLSERELSVVTALFDGLRVAHIAERDGVAVKTVRNQLASAYRKLDVRGQEDLLRRYHRPAT